MQSDMLAEWWATQLSQLPFSYQLKVHDLGDKPDTIFPPFSFTQVPTLKSTAYLYDSLKSWQELKKKIKQVKKEYKPKKTQPNIGNNLSHLGTHYGFMKCSYF